MVDTSLRDLERRARASGELNDVLAYCAALERLGPDALQGLLGTGRDAWQNLMYRHALKNNGRGRAGLDLRLPHKWQAVEHRDGYYCEVREILTQLCYDDQGLQPFFGTKSRPLTFKETVQARIDQFDQSQGKEWSLWQSPLDTCTGIVYEADGQRFKIVPMHPDLIVAQSSMEYLPANFANTPGEPLTVDGMYNRLLTMQEVIAHPGWLAALEGDAVLLQRYAQIAFAQFTGLQAMSFDVSRPRLPDHLRALCANHHNGWSCRGDRSLNSSTRFARVRPL